MTMKIKEKGVSHKNASEAIGRDGVQHSEYSLRNSQHVWCKIVDLGERSF